MPFLELESGSCRRPEHRRRHLADPAADIGGREIAVDHGAFDEAIFDADCAEEIVEREGSTGFDEVERDIASSRPDILGARN